MLIIVIAIWFCEQYCHKSRKSKNILHEANYVAQVEIELIDSSTGWSPSMSLDTAYILDDIRLALRQGDIQTAAKYATVFEIKKIA